MEYNLAVEDFESIEYPMLQGKTYLDHGGTTIYAKSLIDSIAADLTSNLYGNPHSASTPARLSGQLVDETRERALNFFGADPEHFDLVFVPNATGAIRLVMECFRDLANSEKSPQEEKGAFWYGYHVDSHTSLVGVRETAKGNHNCFRTDLDVEQWLSGRNSEISKGKLGLFAYPGQSNMTGRRLPLDWSRKLRTSQLEAHQNTYSLLDAAALSTTYPLNGIFSDKDSAPDFTALSFYKIFGYPDLGALIIRRESAEILKRARQYFGGGTVGMITVLGNKPWHISRDVLHEVLEDGTLPFHNIIALSKAIETHERLYGPNPMETISRHASFLGKLLYDSLSALHHPDGSPLCHIYKGADTIYGDSTTQGATVAFNVIDAHGKWVPYTSVVEKLADEKKIYVRAGQHCNPGGIASHLDLTEVDMKELMLLGHRCGGAYDTRTEVRNGKTTGVVRVSLGAMTTIANIESLITFLQEEFMQVPTVIASSLVSSPSDTVMRCRNTLSNSKESQTADDNPLPTTADSTLDQEKAVYSHPPSSNHFHNPAESPINDKEVEASVALPAPKQTPPTPRILTVLSKQQRSTKQSSHKVIEVPSDSGESVQEKLERKMPGSKKWWKRPWKAGELRHV